LSRERSELNDTEKTAAQWLDGETKDRGSELPEQGEGATRGVLGLF